jgi:preprotein translocase subunit SecE
VSGVRVSQPVQVKNKIEMRIIINYVRDSLEELKNNVSWTNRSELQRLVSVVLVFSVLFSLAIWGADTVLSRIVKFYFELIG